MSVTGEAGPPANQAVPLSELAPPPSSEELFGNISELKKAHKTQLAVFEKAQTVNKTRMEQGLEEKLRARKSKRRRANLHEEQMKALSKKYENSLGMGYLCSFYTLGYLCSFYTLGYLCSFYTLGYLCYFYNMGYLCYFYNMGYLCLFIL